MFPVTSNGCDLATQNPGQLSMAAMLNKKAIESKNTIEKLERLKELFTQNPALEEALQIITELNLDRY